jgi:hypothetical protein
MSVSRLIDAIPRKSAEERRQMRENARRVVGGGGPRAIMAKVMLEALGRFEQTSVDRQARTAGKSDEGSVDAPTSPEECISEKKLPAESGHPPAKQAARVATIFAPFRQIPMSKTDEDLVQVLLDHPDSTSEDLSAEMGWRGKGWHLHFGSMCRRREHLLWLAPLDAGRPFYAGILTKFNGRTHGYTLLPEAVEAFARLGLYPRIAP